MNTFCIHDHLKNKLKAIASTYHLSDLKPFKNLTYNYVFEGFQLDNPIVLKIGLDKQGLKRDVAALKAFDGHGMVKILFEHEDFLFLDHLRPGYSLKSYFPNKENEAIHIACDVMKRLHQAFVPISNYFPSIQDWLNILDQEWPIPFHYLEKARIVRDHFLKTASSPVLLHGDLHHDNILKNNDEWVVIDPKGVIGEAAYEVAAFIRNPISDLLKQENVRQIIENRIAVFSLALDIPPARIMGWCFVQAVLAWVWTIEDGCDDFYFKSLTEFFDKYTDAPLP